MPPQFLSIKNFGVYQRYKDRLPPWIKLHYTLLEDPAWMMLDEVQQCRYMKLLLVASRCDNRILNDQIYLQNMLRVRGEIDLTPLIVSGFLVTFGANKRQIGAIRLKSHGPKVAPNGHAETDPNPKKDSRDRDLRKDLSETETQLAQAVCVVSEFEQFWIQYPRKIGKKAAQKAWKGAADKPALPDILLAIDRAKRSEQWTRENGQFIPHPSTWLNQGRWSDQPAERQLTTMERFLARHQEE